MKKYWIKDLTENQVIHTPTKKIAKRLSKKFDKLGLTWISGEPYSGYSKWWYIYEEGTCYLPYKGEFCDLSHYTLRDYEILTIDQLLDFQTNEYPKVMEVSANNIFWRKEVVFMEKNGVFLAWKGAKTIEESEHINDVCSWKFAREIQPVTLELTIDQIAKKFNVSAEQIKIKK